MRPQFEVHDRETVLQRVRREAVRIGRRLHATEPLPVYTTTIERLAKSQSLAEAAQHVAWMSLIVVGDDPIAAVEVETTEHRVSTEFEHVPTAIASALAVGERTVSDKFTIDDVALLKVGQIGVIAIWIRTAALLVPLRLRSNRREFEPNRPYGEDAFVAAAAAAAARIATSAR